MRAAHQALLISLFTLGLSHGAVQAGVPAHASEPRPVTGIATWDNGDSGNPHAPAAPSKPVMAQHAMVVTDQHYATSVGLEILREGGNAVDAAVAVGYAQAVVNPCCGNIGGGGFMTIHLANGTNVFLDFREKAPLKATSTLFQDAHGNVIPGRSTKTYLGVGVPGTVMGLNAALSKYGTMSLRRVMAPAIKLARDGFRLQPGDITILRAHTQDFAAHPNVASIFLNHGRPWKAGEVLRQPQLGRTLELIETNGTRAFYAGPIARTIVAASNRHGGILRLRDFHRYTVVWAKPVECRYRGYMVVTAPPPGSGVTLCEVLRVLSGYSLAQSGYGSVQATHDFSEAERHAFADRNTYLGDPAFVHNPIRRLLSDTTIARIRAAIQPGRATPSSEVEGSLGAAEGMHTTQFSVLDAKGCAVSVTYTINALFGVGMMASNTGFFLNNEMDDFTSKPGVPNLFGLVQGHANAIEPGKRPLSSMVPTIVLRHGTVFMVTGSPGGSTIISTTLSSIVNVIDFGMDMQQAVDAPRLHMQWFPDELFVEPGYLTPTTAKALELMGYTLKPVPAWGADEAILRNPLTHAIEGANDRRRPAGLALGY